MEKSVMNILFSNFAGKLNVEVLVFMLVNLAAQF